MQTPAKSTLVGTNAAKVSDEPSVQMDLFFRTAVSIDLVLFTMKDACMHVMLRISDEAPFVGKPCLPGKLVYPNVDNNVAMQEQLNVLAPNHEVYCRQLRAFTALDRHPLGRVITIPYYAVAPVDTIKLPENYFWQPIADVPELGYDHNEIYNVAFETLQKGLRRKPVCFRLLPEQFTLVELQAIFEQGYGKELDTRNFRRKISASNLLIDTGEKRAVSGMLGKPPRLFAYNAAAFEEKRESSIGYFF